MKSAVLILILTVQCLISFGQTRVLTDDDFNTSGAIKLIVAIDISEAKDFAQQDINKGTPFLLIQSGDAPVVFNTDDEFEKKFQVYYFDQGCIGPDPGLMEVYNIEIFKYLDEEFGKKWRKSIRKDVIGLKEWKVKN